MENWAEPKTAVLRHFLKTNINTETTDSQNINCNKSEFFTVKTTAELQMW